MNPKVIKTEKERQAALKRIDALWNAPKGSSDGDELDLWVTLVESYESKHQAIPTPDPVEAIRFRMDQMGLKPADLAKTMGGRNRVSEVLNRKRPLSVSMMRNLYRDLGVPTQCLLAEPKGKYGVR